MFAAVRVESTQSNHGTVELPSPTGYPAVRVDRRTGLRAAEFQNDYVDAGRPVIITDAAANWRAMARFSWDFFRDRYGHLRKEIHGHSYSLAEVIDWIRDAEESRPAPYPYNLNVEHYFPELLRDMRPELSYGPLDRINHPLLPRLLLRGTEPYELFFGGAGACFPRVHFDALWLHTQFTQIRGSKEFFLFPPEQGRNMYPHPDNPKMSQVEFAEPDPERFPLFFAARAIVETLHEGETLFLPAGWWHATRIHEPCISLGKVQLNRQNWRPYANDVRAFWQQHHPAIAPLVGPYLRALGRLMDLQERGRRL